MVMPSAVPRTTASWPFRADVDAKAAAARLVITDTGQSTLATAVCSNAVTATVTVAPC